MLSYNRVCYICSNILLILARMTKHLLTHEKDNITTVAAAPAQAQNRKRRKNSNSLKIVKLRKCLVCGVMKTSERLRRHMLSHSIVNRYVCPICPSNYSANRDVKVHIVIKHPENYEPINQFICTLCQDKTVFDSIDNLRSHMENDHDIKQIPKPKSRNTGGKWIGDLTSNPMKTVQEIVNKMRAEQKQEIQNSMLMDE